MGRFIALVMVILCASLSTVPASADQAATNTYFEAVKDRPALLRPFLEAMPKGGDIHNHLAGAIYAETYLDWAVESALCIDLSVPRIIPEAEGKDCAAKGYDTAQEVQNNSQKHSQLINGLSLRNFIATDSWSAHDQFFNSFFRMIPEQPYLADALSRVSHRAGLQNISYLELMITLDLPETIAASIGTEWSEDLPTTYKNLMNGPFGEALPGLVKSIRGQYAEAMRIRQRKLRCNSDAASPGCYVEIRMLHQVIRTLPQQSVFASIILGWELIKQDPNIVGLNLVAPEDDHIALTNYTNQMRMIDYLYQTQGPRNVTLHAGELTLGLVMPKHLKFHIREAIEVGHAKRIGHGIDLPFERDYQGLLKNMQEQGIAVEVNLTSNDKILGVSGADHPWTLYKNAGVPMTISSDDEGVSRIDLTHEYQRAVNSYDLSYSDLKTLSYNALKYSFLSEADKTQLLQNLDEHFEQFEDMIPTWPMPNATSPLK